MSRTAHPSQTHHNHHAVKPSNPAAVDEPQFTTQPVASNLKDGYWLETFPFKTLGDDLPDLIGYGLGFLDNASSIMLYKNPRNRGES